MMMDDDVDDDNDHGDVSGYDDDDVKCESSFWIDKWQQAQFVLTNDFIIS